ncbi:MAG: hypothetical protein DRJ37_01455, partial [Thermoprotei archaeon]
PTWKITVLRDGEAVESVETSENSLVFLLPEGDYKVVVESSGSKWSKEVSLDRDTIIEVGKAPVLRLSVKDQFGNPVQVTVVVDGRKFEVKGSTTLELEQGEHLLQIYWNKVLVARKYVRVREEGVVEDIVVEFANLKVRTLDSEGDPLQGCVVAVYWSGNILFAEATGASGEVEFKLPKQRYKTLVNCRGESKEYEVNLREDTIIEHLQEKPLSKWILLSIIAVIASAILLVVFLILKRKLS